MPTAPDAPLLNGYESGNPASYGLLPIATESKKRSSASRVREHVAHGAVDAVKAVPAVILGTLLNILDGVSYGMILFPAAGVFEGLGAMGVTMFFFSALISQLVYSAGASGFAGGNGSMMIEVVPFFHILANSIEDHMGTADPEAVIATTLVAFALSSILTGLTFLALGAFRLGNLIGFFPRHILVGCIGGVGVFLFITGLTVSTRLSDDTPVNLEFLRILFLDTKNFALWAPALVLAVLLRVITARWRGQLILPTYFIVIPVVFYIVVLAARLDLGTLREEGWLFEIEASSEAWWNFYTYFNFSKTSWSAIWVTMPTQLALLFFNLLHPPLNVPALAVSLDQDVDTNKELVAHGYSNLLSGLLGTVYVILRFLGELFYRVGGTTRISGFMLAGTTMILLLVGTGPIAYIPVMVVGALIFVLGIDLMKEALWDTRHRVSRSEYITIVSIMIAMTAWDFVIGVLFGLIVSCFFFVIQNSRRRSIRAVHSGTTLMSTVRRPSLHRDYIREVSKQTTVVRLQGFLFFGTIAHAEDTIRALVDAPALDVHMRFLVVDFALVAGVDMSSAEAFVRLQRLLAARGIVLVVCGVRTADVKRALESVELFALPGVELFETMNDAMEWTENAYLRAWFMSAKAETSRPVVLPGRQDSVNLMRDSVATSPRRSQLRDAGQRTIARSTVPADSHTHPDAVEPFNTLAQAFSSSGPLDRDLFRPLVSYLEHLTLPEGFILWHQGDAADGLYIIEAGVLRATYTFAEPTPAIEESMVPGTLAGELSALAGAERNAEVVVERQAVLWKLSGENLRRLHADHPELARTFTTLVLKAAKVDYDILLSALATRL
ncbi:sulfate transporter family-domain-containing protein [Amylostereum chailletii]|nr:sulfate transporter family-domain-containing protein [Amylostereum chailletii]